MSIKNFDVFKKLIRKSSKQEIMEEMNITEDEYNIYVEELENFYTEQINDEDEEEKNNNYINQDKVDSLINDSLDMTSLILKGVGYYSSKYMGIEEKRNKEIYVENYVNLCKPMLENFGINDLLKFSKVEEMSLTEKSIISVVYMGAMMYIAKQATEMQLKNELS